MRTRKTAGFASAEQATLVAQLGRESRINPDHSQASAFGFVLDKALKLKEAPVAYPIVHSLSKPSSPDAIEVFQHYPPTIKSGNDALADVVVNPSHEPLLSATQLHKKPLGRASAFGLKNRTQMFKIPLNLLNLGGVEEPAVAGNGKVVNPEVNAKNTFSRSAVNSINLPRETEQEKAPSFFINPEQALSQLPISKVSGEASRNFDNKILPVIQEDYAENFSFETCGTWEIVANRGFADYGLAFSSLNNAASLLDTSHSKLCRQHLPQLLVNEWVQLNIIPDSTTPSLINTKLQSLTVNLNSRNYLVGSNDFDLGNSTTNHTQLQKNTALNTLAGQLSSVQCFPQENRKVSGNVATQSPQAAEYQQK